LTGIEAPALGASKAGLVMDCFVAAFKANAAYSTLAELKIPKLLSPLEEGVLGRHGCRRAR
jgi:hypothetical protein